ncbi:hypothetical protein, partial [Bacillus thuringiensis]
VVMDTLWNCLERGVVMDTLWNCLERGVVMDLRTYYENVINELESILLSSEKVCEDNFLKIEQYLSNKSFTENDIDYIFYHLDNLECLVKDRVFLEDGLKRYREKLDKVKK